MNIESKSTWVSCIQGTGVSPLIQSLVMSVSWDLVFRGFTATLRVVAWRSRCVQSRMLWKETMVRVLAKSGLDSHVKTVFCVSGFTSFWSTEIGVMGAWSLTITGAQWCPTVFWSLDVPGFSRQWDSGHSCELYQVAWRSACQRAWLQGRRTEIHRV